MLSDTAAAPMCVIRFLCIVESVRLADTLRLVYKQRLLQRSYLHTVFECRSPAGRTLLGRRQHGKLLWVNAAAVRHNSSQVSWHAGYQSNRKAALNLIGAQEERVRVLCLGSVCNFLLTTRD